MTPLEYFNSKVLYTVEMDDNGYRYWSSGLHTDEVNAYIEQHTKYGEALSDVDRMSANYQPSGFVKRVMKLAELNFFQNRKWCEVNHLESYTDVIEFICNNDLWKPTE